MVRIDGDRMPIRVSDCEIVRIEDEISMMMGAA
jgi:hypothetical protein